MCSALNVPTNGRIAYATDTVAPFMFGTTATYSCNSGFALVGNTVRSCGGNDTVTVGSWSGSDPTCQGKFTMVLLCLTSEALNSSSMSQSHDSRY